MNDFLYIWQSESSHFTWQTYTLFLLSIIIFINTFFLIKKNNALSFRVLIYCSVFAYIIMFSGIGYITDETTAMFAGFIIMLSLLYFMNRSVEKRMKKNH